MMMRCTAAPASARRLSAVRRVGMGRAQRRSVPRRRMLQRAATEKEQGSRKCGGRRVLKRAVIHKERRRYRRRGGGATTPPGILGALRPSAMPGLLTS